MALMARISLAGPQSNEPEDYFESALSIIFPDDATIQHGDKDHDVLYNAPCLPKPLRLTLTQAEGEADRNLFSHYLWNASLLLAELVEGGTWRPRVAETSETREIRGGEEGREAAPALDTITSSRFCSVADFDVTGQRVLELGAGTALPSILAAHLGASQVTVTDYPADVVMANLRANIDRNVKGLLADADASASAAAACQEKGQKDRPRSVAAPRVADVIVTGHSWGELDTPLAQDGRHAYDRIFVCDCLWMPWQHENLRRSISWFLKEGPFPVCWVIAGFHTGREKVAAFFEEPSLAAVDLEVERIWERDCNGEERSWTADRGVEDKTERKRWLAVAVLRRRRQSNGTDGVSGPVKTTAILERPDEIYRSPSLHSRVPGKST